MDLGSQRTVYDGIIYVMRKEKIVRTMYYGLAKLVVSVEVVSGDGL